MVSSGAVHGDLSSISSSLSNYSSTISDLSSSWKGPSFDSLSAKMEEFVSEYTSVLEGEMEAFASACDLYIQYKNAKDNLKIAESNYNEAVSHNDSSAISKYESDIYSYKSTMENLKGQIESDLQAASSTKLTATSCNASAISPASANSASNASVTASSSAIEPHSRISDSERNERINMIGGADKDNIVDIEVPYWDGNEEKTMSLTVNKNLADNYQNAFRQLANIKFPIKSSDTSAYEYRQTVNGTRLSDHAYGSAIDINWDDNPMVDGPNPNSPDENPYVITDDVVKIFADQGFYWGGDWHSKQDYMHFTWTGR